MIKMNKLLFIFLLALSANQLKAQQTIAFGIGGYENFNLAYTKKLGWNSYQVGIGLKPPFKLVTSNYTFSLGVFWDKTAKFTGPKWPIYIVNRFTFWEKDNDYYNWKVLTSGFGVGGKVFLIEKAGINYEFTPCVSFVMNYERKTFEKIGWPKLFNVNYRVGIFKQF